MKLIGGLLGTKEGDILLTEREIDRSQGIKRGQFARIDFDQANMRDRFGNPLGLALWVRALTLLHPCCSFSTPCVPLGMGTTLPIPSLHPSSFTPLAKR